MSSAERVAPRWATGIGKTHGEPRGGENWGMRSAECGMEGTGGGARRIGEAGRRGDGETATRGQVPSA